MERRNSRERDNYVKIVNAQGLVYTHEDPTKDPTLYRYWRENAHYSFTPEEISVLEEAASAVFEMYVEAGDWLFSSEGKKYLPYFNIPEYAMKAVVDSWNEEPACGSVYGRFDFRFGGLNHSDSAMRVPKLYEFNADTPTSLVESTVQWEWFEDTKYGDDQFNSVYERLVAAWERNMTLIEHKLGFKPIVWFSCTSEDPSHEDEMNTTLMLAACQEAGYETRSIYIENLWIGEDGRYYSNDQQDHHLDVVFKLFPWEHMAHEETSVDLFADMANSGYGKNDYMGGTVWIEPPYKMIWSTKAMLAVLWKLFKTDPIRSQFLIPTWFEDEAPSRDSAAMAKGYARKPILSREGADITLVIPGVDAVHGEEQGYGEEGFVIQELALPPVFVRYGERDDVPDGEPREVYTVLGIWMVDGEPAGMGIRESGGPITDNFANFVPHSISSEKMDEAPLDSTVYAPSDALING